ncbi:acyltransferase family protein [Paraburkholderia fungorum]|uniref:acyltransferase family protein n=1 Tax=Paraburkholderia fungorum TaxID=134537 RepID=UPI00387821B3
MTRTLPVVAVATAKSHTYRPDIDGLRAVAVLAVVIFHAFPAALPGGFVGVDIFFVISGYLITGILLADMQAGQYSLARFYARRIRRIFPALVTVLLATWAMGWFCLTGNEYRELGKQMLAGAGFVSNWAFWMESGYFDQTASAKPLLHLWSLGVEEQFYIAWPVLMYVAVRLRRVALVCGVTGLLSFVSAIWLVQYHPSAAFYWPTSRMWELAAGAGLAVAASGKRAERSDNAHSASSIGLLLCVISFIVLNSRLPFPGWFAVPPVLGAVVLIAAGPKGLTNRLLLGNPVAVWFGKISYALYLWHWPLLSLCFIVAGGEPPVRVRIGIIAVSIVLAWLTTVLVERPVRLGPPLRRKLIAPCVLMLGVAYLGGMTYQRDGLGFRKGYSPDADVTTATLGAGHEFVDLTCGVSPADRHLFQFCARDKRAPSHFAVWGDSKADALYWGLVRKSTPGMSWALLARASCPPMAGVHRIASNAPDDADECREANNVALRTLLSNPALTTVVLVAASRDIVGPQFAYDGSSKVAMSAANDGLDNAIAVLLHAGKRVVLMLDNPELRDPRQCMDRRPLAWPFVRHVLGVSDINPAQRCAISYRSYLDGTSAYRSVVDQMKARHPDLTVYDPTSVLCDPQRRVCPMTMNKKYLYSYGDHMSDYANGLVAEQFLRLMVR